MIAYRLDPPRDAVLKKLHPILSENIAPHAAAVDREARFPHEAVTALQEAGFGGLTVSAAFGGQGQSLRVAAAVVDHLAQHCASTAMVFMMHLCGVQCYLAAPDRMAPHLRAAAAGRHLSTLAFSEKGSRSQFWAPVSRAVALDDHTVSLSAEKSWVTSAGHADGIVASAGSVDGTGATVYLLLKNDPGLSVGGPWDALGMRGNASSPMICNSIALPLPDRALCADGRGADVMLGAALPVFLIGQAAIACGIAEAAFAATRSHIMGHSFAHLGSRLADLPNLRANLAEIRIQTDQARALLTFALDRLEAAAPDATLHLLSAKAGATEAAVRVTDLAMRTCGGAAFSRHLALERLFRDSRAAIVMAPTTDHLREFIGRLLVDLPLFG